MYDYSIPDDDGYHVSEYVRGGLVFAKIHLHMKIEVEDVAATFAKRMLHTPVPAVSASVRLVYEMLGIANDPRRTPAERYYAAAFAVMALAALRGIDAQRSSLKHVGRIFFSSVAWNSKKKRAMVWSCPNTFLGYDVIKHLQPFWGGDFLFPKVEGKRGCSLSEATGISTRMASAAIILRHFRELASSAGMPAEVAKLIRRHSWRHFAANVARVAEFSDADKHQVGRWGNLENMPTRYAQEVEEVAMMAIILRVESVVKEALTRVPSREWPWLAGWENLSPHVALRSRSGDAIPIACEPEVEDREDDDEDSDVEEDEVEGGAAQAAPPMMDREVSDVLAAWDSLRRDKLPARVTVAGWTVIA